MIRDLLIFFSLGMIAFSISTFAGGAVVASEIPVRILVDCNPKDSSVYSMTEHARQFIGSSAFYHSTPSDAEFLTEAAVVSAPANIGVSEVVALQRKTYGCDKYTGFHSDIVKNRCSQSKERILSTISIYNAGDWKPFSAMFQKIYVEAMRGQFEFEGLETQYSIINSKFDQWLSDEGIASDVCDISTRPRYQRSKSSVEQ